jgi:uncharacterized protein YkwD
MLRTLIVMILAAQISTQPKLDLVSLELRINELTNAEREKQNLRPLKFDTRLSDIARRHSRDMINRGFFDHINPDKKGPSDRGRAGGYTCRKYVGEYLYEGLSENLFQNNLYGWVRIRGNETSFDWNSSEKIAATTIAGWMSSPGHRANVLNKNSEKAGVGIVIAPNDQVLITQLFC